MQNELKQRILDAQAEINNRSREVEIGLDPIYTALVDGTPVPSGQVGSVKQGIASLRSTLDTIERDILAAL